MIGINAEVFAKLREEMGSKLVGQACNGKEFSLRGMVAMLTMDLETGRTAVSAEGTIY